VISGCDDYRVGKEIAEEEIYAAFFYWKTTRPRRTPSGVAISYCLADFLRGERGERWSAWSPRREAWFAFDAVRLASGGGS